MLKQQLQQKLVQRLSPQQVLAAKLLEATTVEMEDLVRKNMEENEALEESDNDDPLSSTSSDAGSDENESDAGQESADDLILGDYRSEDDIPDYRLQSNNYSKGEKREEIPFSGGVSAIEGLLEQLKSRELTDEEMKIGEFLIGNLDEDGYLRVSLERLSDDLAFSVGVDVSTIQLQAMLEIIQDFDPAGIGARDLQESLLLQVERLRYTAARENAFRILEEAFDEFASQRYESIMSRLTLSEEELKEAIEVIKKLDPKPLSGMDEGSNDKLMHIIPDFNVEVVDEGELSVSLINSRIPELKVSPSYVNMVTDYQSNEKNRTAERRSAVAYIKQKLDAASGFINAIKQRQTTLLSVMEAITKIQRKFFFEGDPALLRPMILKDIADMTGYDISTVSRATINKYVQTRYGVFPLKFFFKEYLLNDRGEETSFKELEQMILDAIKEEDRDNPMNDDQLAALMQEKGYTMARRTVAKYRQQLNIPTSKVRKESYNL